MSRRELDWADRFFARWGYLAVFIGQHAAGSPHLHRTARRHCPHAPRTLPPLYFSGFVAVVLRHWPGLA